MTRRLALLLLTALPFFTLGSLLAYDASLRQPVIDALAGTLTPTAFSAPASKITRARVPGLISATEGTAGPPPPASSTPIAAPATIYPSPTFRASPTSPAPSPSAPSEPPQSGVSSLPTHEIRDARATVERQPPNVPARVVAVLPPQATAAPPPVVVPQPNVLPSPTAEPTWLMAAPQPPVTDVQAPAPPTSTPLPPPIEPQIRVDTTIQPTPEPVPTTPDLPAPVAEPLPTDAPPSLPPPQATAERDDNSGSGSDTQGPSSGGEHADDTNGDDASGHGGHDDVEDDQQDQDHSGSEDDKGRQGDSGGGDSGDMGN